MPTSLTTSLMLSVAAIFALPAAANATPPPLEPWPAPVTGASNPLAGGPWILNGSRATAQPRIRVWLPAGNRKRTAITRRVGGRTVVRGRLTNPALRKSIAGATIQVAATAAGQNAWSLVDTARTSKTGRFRAVVPAGGVTRRIAVLYWPAINSPTPAHSRRLLIRASGRVWLRAQPKPGRLVRVRGRVTGAPIPAGGLLVAVQVRDRNRWPTIRLIRTLPSGRFTATYRFTHRRRAYRIRAVARRQPAWPLYAATSLTTRIRTR